MFFIALEKFQFISYHTESRILFDVLALQSILRRFVLDALLLFFFLLLVLFVLLAANQLALDPGDEHTESQEQEQLHPQAAPHLNLATSICEFHFHGSESLGGIQPQRSATRTQLKTNSKTVNGSNRRLQKPHRPTSAETLQQIKKKTEIIKRMPKYEKLSIRQQHCAL